MHTHTCTNNLAQNCNNKHSHINTENIKMMLCTVDTHTHAQTHSVRLWFLFSSLLPRQPLLHSSAVLVTRKGKGRNREVIRMTNGRIHRKLREHSSSNYAISCLGERREGERDGGRERGGKQKQARTVCRRRGKALKQQKQKEKGTCSRSASCSLAECGAVAFTRSQ